MRGVARVFVLTSNRDLGVDSAYPDIPPNHWVNWRGVARVKYCASSFCRMLAFTRILPRVRPDVVYLNSIFSPSGALWPLFWMWLSRSSVRIVLAPRGMLKPSALSQKQWKKQPLIRTLRLLGLGRRIVFHATSDDEIAEIYRNFGDVQIVKIANVPCVPVEKLAPHKKDVGQVKLTFVGRVHPTKNLLWLIQVLKDVQVKCQLLVIGPVQDEAYHRLCLDEIRGLPRHVDVNFVGVKSESEVRALLADSDAMVLPTLGENFGHAIFESLASGTPVIISDCTIWRNLNENLAGWDLSLNLPHAFVAAIEDVAGMDEGRLETWRRGALETARRFLDQNAVTEEYQSLFFCKMPEQA
jgi:glycosyltransferase involved in cell wall biosynthesis